MREKRKKKNEFWTCDLKFYKNGRSTDRASQDFIK